MKKEEAKKIAIEVLDKVGGKDNISKVLHCVTRLRFNLKDSSLAEVKEIERIKGVLGTMEAGGQLQVIIGPDVKMVYDEVSGIVNQGSLPSVEFKNSEKKKITLKSIFNGILDGISGSLAPVIPVITTCAFFKMITALFGPEMLNLISAESDLYTLLTFVGDSGFYFFPIVIGYSAAKKFNVLPVLGILLGCIMMHPTFIQLANEGTSFSIYGIPCNVQNYANSILPIIMSVWVMSYVSNFFNKNIPSSIRSVFAPGLTIAVMLPISLCILGPAGAYLGTYIVNGLFGLQGIVGFIGIAIIAAIYPLLVITGMHMILITALFQVFATNGFDGFASVALSISSFSIMGVAIGAALRIKNKEQKALATQFAITAVIAGTSEPTLYGICTRYKKPFIGLIAGGFAGGLYAGIAGVISANLVPSTNIFASLAFLGASQINFINGLLGCAIAVVVAAVITYFFGFKKDDLALKSE